MNDPTNPDPGTAAGRIDTWLTAWKHHYGDLGIPFGASLIAGPPPSAEPRACADDFGVLLETLAVVLADRAAETVRAEKAEARLAARDEADAAVKPMRDHMQKLRDTADQNAATFTDGLIAENCDLRTEVDVLLARLADLGDPETERRFVLTDGTESEFDLHQEEGCGCRQETRLLYVGPWRPVFATGGVVGPGTGSVFESGCTHTLPSRADVEQQAGVHSSFWDDLNRRLKDPKFRKAFDETTAQVQAFDDRENDGGGPFRDHLRGRLMAAGTAAAEQWLATRANRRMSDVNRRRLTGQIINALWSEIEAAAIGMAEYIADGKEPQS